MKIPCVRFSLATLLAAVTIVALFCAGYWHFLPAWREYQRKSDLETALGSLKAGPSPVLSGLVDFLRQRTNAETIADSASSFTTRNNHEHEKAYILHQSYGTYCIVATLAEATSNPFDVWSDVKVFYFSPMPPDYKPQTRRAKTLLRRNKLRTDTLDKKQIESLYMLDCVQVVFGPAESNVNLEYKLIHADPSI